MQRAPAGATIWREIAQSMNHTLEDSLALCEPWFGHESLVLSPGRLHFKVHVINDTGQCLVKLFEMYRIDKHGLYEAIAHEKTQACFPLFSGKSSLLKTASDASAGVTAFRACVENLGIDPAIAAATEADFIDAIATIHEKLVPVLVENLPVPEFIERFDRSYTVFFIPRVPGGLAAAVKAISTAAAVLQGRIMIEASDADEVNDSLASCAKDVPLATVGTIAAPARANLARCFVILKRAA